MSSESFLPEITREILLKVPAESLLRCKSVCKEWYSLISDQHFIKSHYKLSTSSTNNIKFEHHRLIYNTVLQENKLISCPLYDVVFNKSVSNVLVLDNSTLQRPPPGDVRIVGSCNGLLCITEEGKDTVFIYNPTTRKSNLLPCSERSGAFAGCYGFGYDELCDDYKVVMTGFGFEVATITYSLKTGKWKEIGHFPFARPLDDGKLLNGALHFVAGNYSTSVDLWKIVSLDLANETYGEVLQPEHHEGDGYLRLGVSGEWLCALYDHRESPEVDVWVMKVYGVKDSWTKLASIHHIWFGQNLTPLCISEDDRKLLLQFGPQLFVYNSKDSSSLLIDNACIDACIVVESLVSPFPPLGHADNNDGEV